ncbi:MAG TPA: histone deacetylase [Candidatus Hydrogenedentes bacterium]|nr:histone deacetylase [Candidatus Hydrogenedentota bacterium]
MALRTGYCFRDEGLLHDTGRGHPECPARLEAIRDAFATANLSFVRLDVEPASRSDLLRVHTAEYVDQIERICAEQLEYPDADTVMVRESWNAALLAAGAAIASCKAVLDGKVDNAFSGMRPPGHHAEADRAMGFCLFNNVAIAARWLRDVKGLARVAILDWDVHHGNGTQHSFYNDDTVYYVSLHQHPLYPGTGFPNERGKNNTNLNIQMEWGNGPKEWLEALDKQVLPEFERFNPDFLLISCGFDAHKMDPLASQRLETETYAEMTRRVKGISKGRIVSLLEGGYHLGALGESAVAHFRALQEDA